MVALVLESVKLLSYVQLSTDYCSLPTPLGVLSDRETGTNNLSVCFQNKTTAGDVFENKMSDVVKGTAKALTREVKGSQQSSQPPAAAPAQPPKRPEIRRMSKGGGSVGGGVIDDMFSDQDTSSPWAADSEADIIGGARATLTRNDAL